MLGSRLHLVDTILAKRTMLVDFNLQELCFLFAEPRIFLDFPVFSEFSRTMLPFSTGKKKKILPLSKDNDRPRVYSLTVILNRQGS